MTKQSPGFSLLEAMIGLAVLAIGSLVFSNMMVLQSQRQKTADSKANYNQLQLSVQSAASSAFAISASSKK